MMRVQNSKAGWCRHPHTDTHIHANIIYLATVTARGIEIYAAAQASKCVKEEQASAACERLQAGEIDV